MWSGELDKHARELQQELDLLTNTTEFRDTVDEFPVPFENVLKPGPNPRSKPCPCESGKKYVSDHQET